MTKMRIVFTKKTPAPSKKYFVAFLINNKVDHKKIPGGVLVTLNAKIDTYIFNRILGFIHYCSMEAKNVKK